MERSSEGFAALFAYASAESELRNISLQSPRITSSGRYNAALVAWSDGLISGCEVMSPTIGTDYPFAAGLAAHANRVVGCKVFLGNIVGTGGNVAGLVADLAGSVADCGVGDCIIYAGVTATTTLAGGLVGIAAPGASIMDSYFTGAVITMAADDNARNIASPATLSAAAAWTHITGNKSYRAGFAALAYEGAEFTDCANYGLSDATTTTAGNAAGICAELKGSATFTRCRNYGKTSGGTYCAGIVSKALPSTFTDCANLADQDNDVSYWGGIIAQADGNAAIQREYILDGCYNTAELKARGNVAGIIANAGYSNNPMRITGCYNTGNLTGAYQVGGIVGQTYARSGANYATIAINRCVSTGQVNGPANGSGPILGINVDLPEKDTYWTTDASVTASYYLDTVCPASTLPQMGVSVTPAQLGLLDLGESWQRGDDFSFPLLSAHAHCPDLLLHVAAIHFSGTDTQAKVTRSFNAGWPAGVTWTADNAAIRPDGTRMHVTNDAFTGTVRLTATCGEKSRTYLIAIDKTVGVDGLDADTDTPVSVRYFTPAGLEVPETSLIPGQPYIRQARYSDGSLRTTRIIAGK